MLVALAKWPVGQLGFRLRKLGFGAGSHDQFAFIFLQLFPLTFSKKKYETHDQSTIKSNPMDLKSISSDPLTLNFWISHLCSLISIYALGSRDLASLVPGSALQSSFFNLFSFCSVAHSRQLVILVSTSRSIALINCLALASCLALVWIRTSHGSWWSTLGLL